MSDFRPSWEAPLRHQALINEVRDLSNASYPTSTGTWRRYRRHQLQKKVAQLLISWGETLQARLPQETAVSARPPQPS